MHRWENNIKKDVKEGVWCGLDSCGNTEMNLWVP
jgi:hypothetical protein